MEERPGRIVLDENTGMLLWQYEDNGSYSPLEVYEVQMPILRQGKATVADRIHVTGHIPKKKG